MPTPSAVTDHNEEEEEINVFLLENDIDPTVTDSSNSLPISPSLFPNLEDVTATLRDPSTCIDISNGEYMNKTLHEGKQDHVVADHDQTEIPSQTLEFNDDCGGSEEYPANDDHDNLHENDIEPRVTVDTSNAGDIQYDGATGLITQICNQFGAHIGVQSGAHIGAHIGAQIGAQIFGTRMGTHIGAHIGAQICADIIRNQIGTHILRKLEQNEMLNTITNILLAQRSDRRGYKRDAGDIQYDHDDGCEDQEEAILGAPGPMKDKLRRFNTADSPSYVLAPNFSHEQANVGTFNAPRQAASSSSYQETQIYSHTPPQQGVLTIAACENCSSQPSVLQQQNNLVASTGASLENDVRHDQLAQTETPRVGGSSPVLIASARSFKDMETYIHAKAAKPSLLDWNDLHNFDKDGFQIHNPSGNPYLMLTLVEITQNGGFQTVGALKLPLSKTCERTSFSNIFSNIPDLSFHNKNNIKIIAYFNGCDTPFLLRSQKHKDADNFIELKGSTTDVSKQNLNRLKTTAFGDVEDFRNLPSKPVFIPVLRLNVVQKKR